MKWTREKIKELLTENDVAVLIGLIRIYELQTDSEKFINGTIDANGVGFTGFDGKILTSIASQYLEKGFITKKQFNVVKLRMAKYAKQLSQIANNELLPVHLRRKVDINPGWIR